LFPRYKSLQTAVTTDVDDDTVDVVEPAAAPMSTQETATVNADGSLSLPLSLHARKRKSNAGETEHIAPVKRNKAQSTMTTKTTQKVMRASDHINQAKAFLKEIAMQQRNQSSSQ
jgi:hypothetical protein